VELRSCAGPPGAPTASAAHDGRPRPTRVNRDRSLRPNTTTHLQLVGLRCSLVRIQPDSETRGSTVTVCVPCASATLLEGPQDRPCAQRACA
jgi:hypothetical protein